MKGTPKEIKKQKYSDWDFSAYEYLSNKTVISKKEYLQIDVLKKKDSLIGMVKFVNYISDNYSFLTITGDFGNWTFCRPFVPSSVGYVSVQYWIEKLQCMSDMELTKLDRDIIRSELEDGIDGELEEYGYEGNELEEMKDWYGTLANSLGSDIEYLYKAFYSPYRPDMDIDVIPMTKKIPDRLCILFDAFHEMCNRCETKENESKI